MRALPFVLFAMVLSAPGVLAHPLDQHAGDPAELRWIAANGGTYRAPIDDATRLTRSCLGRSPVSVSGPSTEIDVLIEGKVEGHFRAYRSGEALLMISTKGELVQPGRWCRAEPEVLAAIGRAQRLPPSRGPWLAFIALVGGIAVAVGLVALWGAGRGPEPRLEPSEDQHH